MQMLLRVLLFFVVLAGTSAFKSNKANGFSHLVRKELDDTETDRNCHHHHHHHKMPKFLKRVSEEARIQFYFMMKDFTVSFDKKLEELKEWAEKNNVESDVDEWINKIMKFWEDVNMNMEKVLEELPKVYPTVYEILSDGSLTAMEMLQKIRALKLDRTVAKSLYAVSMVVIHSSGQYPYMSMRAGDFFEKVADIKEKKLVDDSAYDLLLN